MGMPISRGGAENRQKSVPTLFYRLPVDSMLHVPVVVVWNITVANVSGPFGKDWLQAPLEPMEIRRIKIFPDIVD